MKAKLTPRGRARIENVLSQTPGFGVSLKGLELEFTSISIHRERADKDSFIIQFQNDGESLMGLDAILILPGDTLRLEDFTGRMGFDIQ